MKSLRDLNTSAKKSIPFIDGRPTTVSFNNETADNTTVSTYENRSFTVNPGTEITSLINLSQPLVYSINLALLPGATLSWGNLTGVGSGNLTTSSTGQLYTVSNIRSLADWNAIKSPTISVPLDSPNWVFSSNIWYDSDNKRTWNTSVNVIQLDQLDAPSDYYYPDGITNQITGTPNVFDLGLSDITNANLTLTLTSSNVQVYGNLSSSGTGGTSSWYSANSTLIISGNIDSVNSHLDNLYYTPVAAGLDETWYLNYQLYNPTSSYYTNKQQFIKSSLDLFLSRPESAYFTENTSGTISGTPLVVDSINNPNGTFTLTIYPSTTSAVSTLSSTGSGGTSSFNGTTKTLTITGTKAQVNSHLAAVTMQPGLDYDSDFYLNYRLVTSGGDISVRIQQQYVINSTGVSNTTVSRTFESNGANYIFANSTPQITETVSGATYSLYLTSSAGKFHNGIASGGSVANVSSNYLVTGTKTQVNSALTNIVFYPNKDTIGSQTFNMQLIRNSSTTLVSQNIGLTGTTRTTPISGITQVTYDYYYNNPNGVAANWYAGELIAPLTYEQCFYLKANVVVVGRGGSGEANGTGHGGGGGVVVANAITFGSTVTMGLWSYDAQGYGTQEYGSYRIVSTGLTTTARKGDDYYHVGSTVHGGNSGAPTTHSYSGVNGGGAGGNASGSAPGPGLIPTNVTNSTAFGRGGGGSTSDYGTQTVNWPYYNGGDLTGIGGKAGTYPSGTYRNPADGKWIFKFYEG